MGFWTKRRSRQLIVLILIAVGLVLSGALAAYADSTERDPMAARHARAQGDATPTATLVVPVEGAEAAVVENTEVATPTTTITPTTASPTHTPTPLPAANVIFNGDFEEGFVEGQGMGVGWGRFQNGNVMAGWYDDTWFKVVYNGEHAQLLELRDAGDSNRYVGIFQTVSVVPNAEYELTLHGLVRSDEGSPEASNYGYRMQYGIDFNGGTNWESEDIQWVELMWDDQPREDLMGDNEYRMEAYSTRIKAQTDKLTLFIRGWKKWPDAVEGNYDVDCVSLVGAQGPQTPTPVPTSAPTTQAPTPTATPESVIPETGNEISFIENPVMVVASAALLLVLAGGALWGLNRRRGV
jgi:hypothetical protein